MAAVFRRAGIPAVAVTGQTPGVEREGALRDLRVRAVNVVFTVDLFNEGVDVPEADTILLLRPTESATVFLQQLGRGLRRLPGKRVCTVLDFIAQQHRRFRFDLRFRALLGGSRARMKKQVEEGFPFLPAGCHLELDQVAARAVLNNIRQSLQVRTGALVPELSALAAERGDVGLAAFLDATGIELHELWKPAVGGWTALRRAAGLKAPAMGPEEKRLRGRVPALLHIDDPERLDLLTDLVTARLRSPASTSGGGGSSQCSTRPCGPARTVRVPGRSRSIGSAPTPDCWPTCSRSPRCSPTGPTG
jgi:hypothetical protein